MKVKVFSLPWRSEGGGFDDAQVEAFLAERTAIDVSEHFFVHEKTPVLVLVVTYRGGDAGGAGLRPAASRATGHDAASDLTPDERRRYEALRTWRNQYARKFGKPPYVVFTNSQAADLARRAPTTRAQLGEVSGIGTSRVEDFGDELLAFLAAAERAATGAVPDGGTGAATTRSGTLPGSGGDRGD